jgi:hypothetical protein
MFYEFVRLRPDDTVSGLATGIFRADFDPFGLKRNDFSKLPNCENGTAADVLVGEGSQTDFSEVDWYLRRDFDGKPTHEACRHDLGIGGRVLSQSPRIRKSLGRIPQP